MSFAALSTLMLTTQKIKVVIEVELTNDDQARSSFPLVPKFPDSEAELDLEHARTLLAALRADPVHYAEFVKTVVVGGVQVFEESRELVGLAGIGCPYSASLAILRKVMPQLSQKTQEYFQRADDEHWLSEGVDLIFNAIKATPIHLSVEYPVVHP